MILKKLCVLAFPFFVFTPCWALDTSVSTTNAVAQVTNPPTSAKPANETNTPTDPGKPIMVKSISPVFTIFLSANPTTGYSWYLADYNPRFVRLLEQHAVSAQNNRMGAPGMSVWQFQLQQISFSAPQITRITFEYRRPWELKAVKKQSFIVMSQQPTK